MLDFRWNGDTMGLVGRKGIGKTHLTNEFIELAAKAKPHPLKKEDVWILDAKGQYKDYINVYEADINECNAKTLDKFLSEVYKEHDKLVVTDDLDLFIKSQNESEYLANFLINAGTGRHIGLIWQSKRLKNMDTRLQTETKYLVLGQGINSHDLDVLEDSGFDGELYDKEIRTGAANEHRYILLNTFTHENKVIGGFE